MPVSGNMQNARIIPYQVDFYLEIYAIQNSQCHFGNYEIVTINKAIDFIQKSSQNFQFSTIS